MKQKELYSLRDKSLPFNDFEEFKEKIRTFFDEKLNFPVVVGYQRFPQKENWEIKNLPPLENSDRLTVLNFLGGLEEISEGNKNRISSVPIEFRGSILYLGLESLHYNNWNDTIFLASMDFKNSKQYSLTLTFSGNNNRRGYHATSGSFETTYDNIMERYLSPNRQ